MKTVLAMIAAALTSMNALATGPSPAAPAINQSPSIQQTVSPTVAPVIAPQTIGASDNHFDNHQRTVAIGLAASVSAATCYGSILGGLAVWSSEPCVRHFKFLQFLGSQNFPAAHEFLCQDDDQRAAILAAGQQCKGEKKRSGPIFQTGAEGDHGWTAYRPFRQEQ